MRRPAPLPEPLDAGSFTVQAALQAGLDPGRLRRSDLHRPFRGVRASELPETLEERCRAYLPLLAPGAVFTHATAGALHGLPLPAHLDRAVLLHVGTPAAPPRRLGVQGHRLRPGTPQVVVRDLPVVSVEEAWCQLGEVLGVEDLIVAGDHLLRRGVPDPEAVLRRLRDALHAVRRRGSERLMHALALLRPGVRSPRESLLRAALVLGGLPEPEINVRLHAEDGSYLGEGDLVYREARLVLEYEGDQHRTDPVQWRRDIRRRERFEDAAWSVVRITADDVSPNRAEMLRRVAHRLGCTPRMQKVPPSRPG